MEGTGHCVSIMLFIMLYRVFLHFEFGAWHFEGCFYINVTDHLYNLLPWGGGGELTYKRLMWMCRWMGSHFHDWIDYNGVAFSIELVEWSRTFSDFWGKTVFHIYG